MSRARKAVFAAVGVAVFVASVFALAGRVGDNSTTITQICESSNRQNAKEIKLWNFVVELSANSPSLQTPEQRAAQVKQLDAFLADIFRQEECD